MKFDKSKMKSKPIKATTPAAEVTEKKFDPSKLVKNKPVPVIQPKAEVSTTNRPLEPDQMFEDFEAPESLGVVRAWSFSSLKSFEQCAARMKFKVVDGIKEPANEAMERGSAIHQLAEDYIQGKIEELPKELSKFPDLYQWMRDEFAAGNAIVEEDWAFRIDWSQCGWTDKDAWHRAKLDCLVFENDGKSAVIVDHKTGRKDGNAHVHSQQGLLYAIDTFLRYPELEFVKYMFVYVDKGGTLDRILSREQALRFHAVWHKRGLIMTTATVFDYDPSPRNCRWCYYGKEGICEEAYRDS